MALAARKPPADADIDDHLDPADFSRIAGLISTEVGIKLPPAKRLMVEGRLLCEGAPREVIRDPRVIDAYLGGAAA